MKLTRLSAFLGPLLFAATAGPAFGELTLSADPAPFTIAPGQTKAIDVYVEPSSSGGSDLLSIYNLTFQIVSSGGNVVTFTAPSSSADAMFDPNTTSGYVFEGISSFSSYPGTPAGTPPHTQIILEDFTSTFADTTISSKKLLAVLYLVAPASPLPPPGGESLSVNLVSSTMNLSNSDFSISGELVPTAVPESSTLVLTLIGAPLGVLILRRSGLLGTAAS